MGERGKELKRLARRVRDLERQLADQAGAPTADPGPDPAALVEAATRLLPARARRTGHASLPERAVPEDAVAEAERIRALAEQLIPRRARC